MKKYNFISAKPIFYPYTQSEYKEIKDSSCACHYRFYKSITLSKEQIDNAYISITAQNIYRLYINEEIIMQGPRRTAHGYLRVDKINISKYLCEGQNHIAVELVEYGNMYNGYSNDSTLEDGMLILEIMSGEERIFSTGIEDMDVMRLDYRVKKSERISHSREAVEIYNIKEDNDLWKVGNGEYVNAAQVDIQKTYLCTDVLHPTLEKHKFENIVSYGSCKIDREKKFKKEHYEWGDYFEKYGESVYTDCRQTLDLPPASVRVRKNNGEICVSGEGDSYIMLDMGRSIVGLLCVDIESDGGTLDFFHTEMLDKKGDMPYYYGTVSRIRTDGNIKHIFFEAGLYRYLKIYFRGCKNIKIKDISLLEYSYPDENKCSFLCNDENINNLYKAAKTTLLLNTLDVFMDCPDRERGQWIGDVSVQAPQVFFVFDREGVKLLKKSILDFIQLRKGDVLVGNVPGHHFSELPGQSLIALSDVGLLGEYYRYTLDEEVLQLALEPAVNYLKLWDLDERGLLVPRKGNWYWFDHLWNVDAAVLENCSYVAAAKFALKMAEITGCHEFDDFLKERVDRICAGIEAHFWKGKYYASGDFVDDRANALTVLAGVCPAERFPKIRTILLSVFNATTYMERFVLKALCEMGYIKDAYNRMMSRYYNLAVNDNSTLWEDFYILGTRNHAWSGCPLEIAFRYFLGLKTEDAFKTYTINPVPGIFKEIECSFGMQDGTKTTLHLKNLGEKTTECS